MNDPKATVIVAAIRLACLAPMRLTVGVFTLTPRAVADPACRRGRLKKFKALVLGLLGNAAMAAS